MDQDKRWKERAITHPRLQITLSCAGLLAGSLQVRELGLQLQDLLPVLLLAYLDDEVQETHAWPVGSGVVELAKRGEGEPIGIPCLAPLKGVERIMYFKHTHLCTYPVDDVACNQGNV